MAAYKEERYEESWPQVFREHNDFVRASIRTGEGTAADAAVVMSHSRLDASKRTQFPVIISGLGTEERRVCRRPVSHRPSLGVRGNYKLLSGALRFSATFFPAS